MDLLFFDVETVVDGELLAAVKYPGLDPQTALIRARTEAEVKSNGDSDWINAAFHRPVCVAVAEVELGGLRLVNVQALDGDGVAKFWAIMTSKDRPKIIVSFNGRGFDLPVLELAAMRGGIVTGEQYWDGSRDRYKSNHVDLKDLFDNKGAVRLAGGLDMLAKVCGHPGKMGTCGADVADLVKQGFMDRVREYCMMDVLETYLLYVRLFMVRGARSKQDYEDAICRCVDMAGSMGIKEGPLAAWAVRMQVLRMQVIRMQVLRPDLF